MKKVMLVFGTRPEAIKMCPLVKEFQKYPNDFETIVCVTGQHREMLDQVLRIFEVVPDIDLNIMKQGQDLYDITARVLTGMRDVFKECKPDVVLVHGDTTTSTAAALAAFYQQIPVGHVEAGLRTHNIYSPWPEEMNRQITGRIATYNFSPTPLLLMPSTWWLINSRTTPNSPQSKRPSFAKQATMSQDFSHQPSAISHQESSCSLLATAARTLVTASSAW